jgi:tRNA(Ile)-lysidine synthase
MLVVVGDILPTVRREILARALLPSHAAIVVAVSGGADSVVLLDVLRRLAPEFEWNLHVAHFNHQLRGRSAIRDALFVQELGERWKIPVRGASADTAAYAQLKGISLEMAARELRHKFLVDVAKETGSSHIALAHHADDQVEQFFLRLFRGAASDGLGGMAWSAPSPVKPSIHLIRPLLGLDRAEIIRTARRRRLQWRTDSTNNDTAHLRNRVRTRLIPYLIREYSPALSRVVLRAMGMLRDEGELVEQIAMEWLKSTQRVPFEALHPAVQRRVLRRNIWSEGISLDYEQIEAIRREPGRLVTAPGGVVFSRDNLGRVVVAKLLKPPPVVAALEIELDKKSGRIVIPKSRSPDDEVSASCVVRWRLESLSKNWRPRAGCERFSGWRDCLRGRNSRLLLRRVRS